MRAFSSSVVRRPLLGFSKTNDEKKDSFCGSTLAFGGPLYSFRSFSPYSINADEY
jgi:hypothetical protein